MDSAVLIAQALHALLSRQAEAQRQAGNEKQTLRAMVQLHHFAQRALMERDGCGTGLLDRAIDKAAQVLEQVNADAASFLEGLDGDRQLLTATLARERAAKVDGEVEQVRLFMEEHSHRRVTSKSYLGLNCI